MRTIVCSDSSRRRIIVRAETEEKIEKIIENLKNYTEFSEIIQDSSEDLLKLEELSETYKKAAENPERCMNYHIRKGSSKLGNDSFIDWWTLTSKEDQKAIILWFMNRIEDEIDRVKEKTDIEPFLEEKFPLIGRHGLKELLGEKIWELRKEEGTNLSELSERALENGKNGKEFEDLFRNLCERNGLRCYRKTSRAFREYFPKKYREIRKELGTMRGIPDFLVDKKNSKSLGNWIKEFERFWEPENRFAFVEVKYNSSKLSKHQKKMVEHLKKHGIETALFKGDFENHRITRI